MTTTTSAITTGTWILDPTHTEIGFTVRHLIGKVRGKFTGFDGAVVTTICGRPTSLTLRVGPR